MTAQELIDELTSMVESGTIDKTDPVATLTSQIIGVSEVTCVSPMTGFVNKLKKSPLIWSWDADKKPEDTQQIIFLQ